MIATQPLSDLIAHIESAIVGGGLEMRVLDVVDLRRHTDENLHRGFCVNSPTTANLYESRQNDHAVSSDVIEVQIGFQLRPHEQRVSRAEALILEEQVRGIVTSRAADWPVHLVWTGTTREFPPADQGWMIITQRFTGRRYARLGG